MTTRPVRAHHPGRLPQHVGRRHQVVEEVLDDDHVGRARRHPAQDLGGVAHHQVVAQEGPGQVDRGLAQVGARVAQVDAPLLGHPQQGRGQEPLAAGGLEDPQGVGAVAVGGRIGRGR